MKYNAELNINDEDGEGSPDGGGYFGEVGLQVDYTHKREMIYNFNRSMGFEDYIKEVTKTSNLKMCHITAETMSEITGLRVERCQKILERDGKSLDNKKLWYEMDMRCK